MSTYLFSNAYHSERTRLAALETVYDPGSFMLLSGLGVGPGWRVWEVGAGGGSVAAWLAERAGPEGRVLATDLDTRFIEPLAARGLVEVQRHDVVTDLLPDGLFDLIHARMVLDHLPRRADVLCRLASVLAPGGWLAIEAIDFRSEGIDPATNAADAAIFDRMREARSRMLVDHGFDHGFARGLPRMMRQAGLTAIATEGRVYGWQGGSPGATAWKLSTEQAAARMIERGYVEQTDIDGLMRMLDDPSFSAISPAMLATVGRRPPRWAALSPLDRRDG